MRIHKRTDLSLVDLREWLNPIIAGWMHYSRPGSIGRGCIPSCGALSFYLRRWAARKYKRLRGTYKRFKRWWTGLLARQARPVRPLAVGSRVLNGR